MVTAVRTVSRENLEMIVAILNALIPREKKEFEICDHSWAISDGDISLPILGQIANPKVIVHVDEWDVSIDKSVCCSNSHEFVISVLNAAQAMQDKFGTGMGRVDWPQMDTETTFPRFMTVVARSYNGYDNGKFKCEVRDGDVVISRSDRGSTILKADGTFWFRHVHDVLNEANHHASKRTYEA